MRFATTSLRAYVAASIMTTCYISWSIPESITSKAVLNGQPVGRMFLVIALFLSIGAIFDIIVNESRWIPFSSPVTKRWRQLGFMMLAMVSGAMAFLVLRDYGPHPVILRYMLDSCAAVIVAMLGLRDLMEQRPLSSSAVAT